MRRALALLLLLPASLSAQDRPDGAVLRKVHESVRRSLVGLELTLKKPSRLDRESRERREERRDADGLAQERLTLDTWGVVLDAAGRLAMADPGLDPSSIEKIAGTSPDGSRFEAVVDGVGRRHDCLYLKADPPPPGAAPLAFEDFEPFALGDAYSAAYVERVDGRWHVNLGAYLVTNAPLAPEKGAFRLTDRVRPGSVVHDAKGRCVGVAFDDTLWSEPGGDSFLGKAFAAEAPVPLKELEDSTKALKARIGAAAHKVELELRVEAEDRYGRDAGPGSKLVLYGLPVDAAGTLVVPSDLPAAVLRRVETVTVTPPGGAPAEGTLKGRFRDFGALLVTAPGVLKTPVQDATVRALARGPLYHVCGLEEKFGGLNVEVEPRRILRIEKAPKGAWREEFRRPTRLGSFVADASGRIVGLYVEEREDGDLEDAHEEEEMEAYSWRRGRSFAPPHRRKIRLFADLAPLLADPEPRLDPRAKPLPKTEEKRLAWLGVEFQELTRGLAKHWGLEDRELTNDGRRGLLVTDVYPGSPAERLGIRERDILLSITPPGEGAKPTDLAAPEERRYGMRDSAAPWRPRKNVLTSMLTQIGEGKEVGLEVLRGKEKLKMKLKIELEPKSFETAEKHKDAGMGLTLKDLTYEARYFHRLEPAVEAVVVSKIESGSRAEVAKLELLSLITRVNDEPVGSLADFRRKVEAARKSGAKTLTLTVRNLGQTRLADVDLAEGE